MTAYWYDKITKEYKGMRNRQFHNDIYLMPGSCTGIEPPKNIPEGKALLFREDKWELVDDMRGKKYYDINTQGITISQDIEFIVPAELTDIEPPAFGIYEKLAWNGIDWDIIKLNTEEKKITIKEKIREELPEILMNLSTEEGFDKIKERITEIKLEAANG